MQSNEDKSTETRKECIRLIDEAARLLSVSFDEARRLIRSAFIEQSEFQPDVRRSPAEAQEHLLGLFGYENIALVFSLAQNTEFFAAEDSRSEELAYVEYVLADVPPAYIDPETLVPVSATGDAQKHFSYARFNGVQSRCFDAVFNSDQNILVSAPTSSGKTDIALLAILRAVGRGGKAIYIAPMKALATEITNKFNNAFKRAADQKVAEATKATKAKDTKAKNSKDCKDEKKAKSQSESRIYRAVEYTGDTEIEAGEADKYDVVICTPEKFDVSTRRRCQLFKGIRLVVIDEIHLLNDDRGPILEEVVARMFRLSELNQSIIRIIGLSATLPNYRDVAAFIKAERTFYFDASYRPVPLRVAIAGFKKSSKRADQEAYLLAKVAAFMKMDKQVLVFVHSRIGTTSTAKMIAENVTALAGNKMIISDDQLDNNDCDQQHGFEARKPPRKKHGKRKVLFADLAFDSLAASGVGVHHAGMSRADRHAMEALFSSGQLRVLVCTSTLAWGVNLPAYAVIINGTSFYNPQKGGFDDLGILDVVQIFGRAGRPQFDSRGEAVLITTARKTDHYIALLKGSKDIESKLLFHLTDALCAEIYLCTISSVATARLWLKNTFLYVRMGKSPALYGIDASDAVPVGGSREEAALADYIAIAARRLESSALIRIARPDKQDAATWRFEATEFGRVASLYFLSHLTLHRWLENIQDTAVLGLLLSAEEFKDIRLRDDETAYLMDMHSRMLKRTIIDFDFESSAQCKISILVAAYFSYLQPPTFPLLCDTDFIIDGLKRMVGALKEVYLVLGMFGHHKNLYFVERQIFRMSARKTTDTLQLNEKFYNIDCRLYRCGRFVDAQIEAQGKQTAQGNQSAHEKQSAKGKMMNEVFTLYVYQNADIVYVGEFNTRFRSYIKVAGDSIRMEIHTPTSWMIVNPPVYEDFSVRALYYYGIHSCQSVFTIGNIKEDCSHFITEDKQDHNEYEELGKLDSDKESEFKDSQMSGKVVDNARMTKSDYKSKNRTGLSYETGSEHSGSISTRIHRLTLSNKTAHNTVVNPGFILNIATVKVSVSNFYEKDKSIDYLAFKIRGHALVLCPGTAAQTCSSLNTLLSLETRFSELYVLLGGSATKSHRIVANFSDVIKHPEVTSILGMVDTVIFKGCYHKGAYYPMYDVLWLCNGKKAIIYENDDFIQYLSQIV